MALGDIFRGAFSFLSSRSKTEEVLAEYIVREHTKGRSLEEVLADHYIQNRATKPQIDRILERPEVVHAIGEAAVEQTRQALAEGRV
ncbi:MAG: hypothetical protein QOE36_2061 [Gaiellaceae bacterium]|jgi:hypothetical protein|nr:hypothetical protein [Gaiellaceae bacterium]